MRQRRVILEAFEDDSTGTLGLGVVGMPRNESTNSSTGLGIAHDLLEHVNGVRAIGDIADELEALGGVWYVRGQFSDIARPDRGYYTPHRQIASDIARMFRDAVEGGAYLDTSHKNTRRCDADYDFELVLEHAAEDWRGEVEDHEEGGSRWPEFRALCLHRMRTGYRKATRLYPQASAVNTVFWQIRDEVDRTARPEHVGQRWVLSYGPQRVRCDEDYGDDY